MLAAVSKNDNFEGKVANLFVVSKKKLDNTP